MSLSIFAPTGRLVTALSTCSLSSGRALPSLSTPIPTSQELSQLKPVAFLSLELYLWPAAGLRSVERA